MKSVRDPAVTPDPPGFPPAGRKAAARHSETDWAALIQSMESLDGCEFDHALIGAMQQYELGALRPLSASAPSFQAYATSELQGCGKTRFPVFSVTGAACALQCDHCQARILEPMIAATTPEALDSHVRALASTTNLAGFLLSGGSNRRNEIAYERYYPVVEGLKRDFPGLRIAVHTGLLDRRRAHLMASAGVDTAMMDVIASNDTIRDVYHLDRTADDFEATLAALTATEMSVTPHIVIGLHYGRIKGERDALAMVARHPVDALVLVVVMPVHARPGTFVEPPTAEVGSLFLDARRLLPELAINLGCARPHGLHRRTVDAYAVMAGLDGIAFPSEGTLSLARAIGRPVSSASTCCGLGAARSRCRPDGHDVPIAGSTPG